MCITSPFLYKIWTKTENESPIISNPISIVFLSMTTLLEISYPNKLESIFSMNRLPILINVRISLKIKKSISIVKAFLLLKKDYFKS